jgi:hypothetical protein
MKLRLELEQFLSERRFKLEAQKKARARLLGAHARLTRVSVGGKEFAVRDGVVELPEELAAPLLAQGWRKLADQPRPAGAPGKQGSAAGRTAHQG